MVERVEAGTEAASPFAFRRDHVRSSRPCLLTGFRFGACERWHPDLPGRDAGLQRIALQSREIAVAVTIAGVSGELPIFSGDPRSRDTVQLELRTVLAMAASAASGEAHPLSTELSMSYYVAQCPISTIEPGRSAVLPELASDVIVPACIEVGVSGSGRCFTLLHCQHSRHLALLHIVTLSIFLNIRATLR